jgi:hypothetical protein
MKNEEFKINEAAPPLERLARGKAHKGWFRVGGLSAVAC